jgi:sulfoxide reductase heme-binding subunit YedZ
LDIVGAVNRGLRRIPPLAIYIVGLIWAVWYFWLGLSNQLGPEPINVLEREYGLVALKLIVLGLAVSPLRRLFGINLIKQRRAIGVTAFFFVLAHLLVFAVLDVQSLERVWTEVVKRPYVTIGMLSFLLMLPLAVTSNDLSIRKMGAMAWRRLHKLFYPAALLGGVHYLWLVKGFQIQPLIYLALIVVLLLCRKIPTRRRTAA